MWGVTESDGDVRGWRKSRSSLEKKLEKLQDGRNQSRKFIDLGRLVIEAEIGELPPEMLLGAFLEIRDILKDPQRSKDASFRWSSKGKALLNEIP
jgi:Conjugal transfer protein TraD